MSIPIFIEYFVECRNWLKDMNNAKKFLYFLVNCAMLPPTSPDISSSTPHHLPHQCWLQHREWDYHPLEPWGSQIYRKKQWHCCEKYYYIYYIPHILIPENCLSIKMVDIKFSWKNIFSLNNLESLDLDIFSFIKKGSQKIFPRILGKTPPVILW